MKIEAYQAVYGNYLKKKEITRLSCQIRKLSLHRKGKKMHINILTVCLTELIGSCFALYGLLNKYW